MKAGFWKLKWWVLLPAAMPVLAFLWLRLGVSLQLPVTPAPNLGATSGLPQWIATGYYAVQHLIWIFLSPGAWLLNTLHDDPSRSPSAFLLATVFSVVMDCLVLYLTLLSARCGNPRWYVKS